MAFVYGYALAADGTGESSNFAAGLRSAPQPPTSDLFEHTVLVGVGSTTAPPPPPIETYNGIKLLSSFDDWYYRIHFIPTQFELGNLVGRQQRTLTIWNAFFEPISLDSYTLLNGEGILVDEPVVAPATVLPLQLLRYDVEILTEGPPVIDATMVFVFDGVTFEVPIVGRRIVVFPFKPNWSNQVDETIQYLTSLQSGYTGLEQVAEIRAEPRRIMEYNLRIFGFESNLFDTITWGWSGRLYALPIWQEKAKLLADAAVGATTLQFATANRTFEVGSLALLFRDVSNFEIFEVETVAANSVTTARPIALDWPINTRVYPVMISAMEATSASSRQVDTHVDAAVRFVCSPADNRPRMPVVAAPATYRGNELYVGETNWVSPMNMENKSRETRNDGEGTGIFRLTRRGFPQISRGFRWLAKDRSQAELVRQFFARRRGRFKPVWVPSGMRDFELLADVTSAQSTLFVRDTGYGQMIDMNPTRSDIVIILKNGTRIARKITDYDIDEFGRGAMQLDSAVGVNVPVSAVKKISFLGLWRLSGDAITFSWRTDGVAVIETNLVSKDSSQ